NPGNIPFGIGSIYEPLSGPDGTNARKAVALPSSQREGFSNPLSISTRWLYTWTFPATEAEASYNRINSNNAVPPGYGFTMKGVDEENHERLYEFRGRPNSGTFSVPVEGPDGDNQRMVLAGNPYPSVLDLNWLFHDTPNHNLVAFYFYDEDRTVKSHLYREKPYGFATLTPGAYDAGTSELGNYTAATFYIWNAAGSHSNNGPTSNSGKTATRFAPIGQGILFAGISGSGTVEI